MSCNCNTANPKCEPCAFCTPPGVTGLTTCEPIDPCEEKIDLECVKYLGADYSCLDVTTEDSLLSVILKIFDQLYPQSGCPTTTTTSTTTTLPPCSVYYFEQTGNENAVFEFTPCGLTTPTQITLIEAEGREECVNNNYSVSLISGEGFYEGPGIFCIPTTTTSTTSTTTTTTVPPCVCYTITNNNGPDTPARNFTFLDCNGLPPNPARYSAPGTSQKVCARQGTVVGSGITITLETGVSCLNCTTTTTTASCSPYYLECCKSATDIIPIIIKPCYPGVTFSPGQVYVDSNNIYWVVIGTTFSVTSSYTSWGTFTFVADYGDPLIGLETCYTLSEKLSAACPNSNVSTTTTSSTTTTTQPPVN